MITCDVCSRNTARDPKECRDYITCPHKDLIKKEQAKSKRKGGIIDACECLEVCLTRCTREYCQEINGVTFADASPLCDMAIFYVRTIIDAAQTPAQTVAVPNIIDRDFDGNLIPKMVIETERLYKKGK